jgi:hypothetical protein
MRRDGFLDVIDVRIFAVAVHRLSITHKFGSDEKTELDIGETG